MVLVAHPLNIGAYPSKRADMVLAAMRYLNGTAPVQSILDPARTALIGHSMGGGGVLEAAERAQVSAVIAIHPWAQRSFPNVTAPTQVIGGGLDAIAPFSSYTLPIYQSLTDAKPKSLLTSLAGTHWAGVVDDPALQGRNLAFLKTFVDGDARYQALYTDWLPSVNDKRNQHGAAACGLADKAAHLAVHVIADVFQAALAAQALIDRF